MSWFKKHFPSFHKAPTLLDRRVPAWTHLPAIAVLLVVGFALVYNVNELVVLRRAVVEQERLEAMSKPYGGAVTRSLVFGDAVCRGNLLVRVRDWIKGDQRCDDVGTGGLAPFMDMGTWCNAWNRWYYGGAGCPATAGQ